jgi:hypothetical protein
LDAKVFQKGMKSFGEIGQAHPHKVVWATTHAPIDEREMFVLYEMICTALWKSILTLMGCLWGQTITCVPVRNFLSKFTYYCNFFITYIKINARKP